MENGGSWEKYAAKDFKAPKSKKLSFGTPKKKQTSWTQLAEIKAKWSEKKLKQEIDFTKAEHELRIANMSEIQKLQAGSITELHDLQKRFLTEKHALEIAILQEQLKNDQHK